MKQRILACGIAALLMSSVAAADETQEADPSNTGDEFVPTGFFVTVSGLAAFDNFASDIPLANPPVDKVDPSFGFSATLGSRLQRNFAVEAQFDWLDGIDVRLDRGHLGRPHGDVEGWMLSANSKLYLSLGRLQPFAKFGFGVVHYDYKIGGEDLAASDPKKSDAMVRFGGGLDLYATRSIAVTFAADYMMPLDKLEEMPLITLNLGLLYRF